MDAPTDTTAGAEKGSRKIWKSFEEDALIAALKEVVAEGFKLPTRQLKIGTLGLLENKMRESIPGTDIRAKPHIESKLKAWKRYYHCLSTMLAGTGIGWNDSIKMIQIDDPIQYEYWCRTNDTAKSCKNIPFPYYDDWCICFGKDYATGEFSETPFDMMNNPSESQSHSEAAMKPTSSAKLSEGTSKSTKSGRKRARSPDALVQGLSKMTDRFGEFFEKNATQMETIGKRMGYAHDLAEQRRDVIKELLKLPLTLRDRVRAGNMIVKDSEKVDYFFSLDAVEREEYISLLLLGEC